MKSTFARRFRRLAPLAAVTVLAFSGLLPATAQPAPSDAAQPAPAAAMSERMDPAMHARMQTMHERMHGRAMQGGMQGGMGGDMQGMSGMHGGMSPEQAGRRMDRMLHGLNVGDAERARIRDIAMAAAADVQRMRQDASGLHAQAMRIYTAPTVDAAAAEQLRQQMLAQHDRVSQRRMQAMLDIAAVLTPEQRQAMGQRMAERQARMAGGGNHGKNRGQGHGAHHRMHHGMQGRGGDAGRGQRGQRGSAARAGVPAGAIDTRTP